MLLKFFVIFSTQVIFFALISSKDLVVSNLNSKCLLCLCYAASNCDMKTRCEDGYCGPYKLSKKYWDDAGNPTLTDEDFNNEFAFENCANSFECSQRTLSNYFSKLGKDCNDDGVTDCDDFAMINFNGGFQCNGTLRRSKEGLEYARRYVACRYEALLVEKRLEKL